MASHPASRPAFEQRFLLTGGIGEESRDAQKSVLDAVEERFDPSSTFAIRLALEEALSNAFKHGNAGDPSKTVTLECRVDDVAVFIAIEDEGPGFDQGSVPDPTETENLEIPSGRGIMLMRSFMTEVTFDPPGNRVKLRWQPPAQ